MQPGVELVQAELAGEQWHRRGCRCRGGCRYGLQDSKAGLNLLEALGIILV